MAWRGEAGLGMAGRGMAWQAWRGLAGLGKAGRGMAWQAGRGVAWQGEARQGLARRGVDKGETGLFCFPFPFFDPLDSLFQPEWFCMVFYKIVKNTLNGEMSPRGLENRGLAMIGGRKRSKKTP